MIENRLKQILLQNKNIENIFYLRTLFKEVLQDYILNFVYNHQLYKKLIFTGGTCLRKIYGLPRLSEDLDLDFLGNFNIKNFADDIKNYFGEKFQYRDLEVRLSGNRKSLFLKFPVLADLGLVKSTADTPILFVRCDFSQEEIGFYSTEINPISTDEFTFFALAYDLPTLFANKIIAFLERKFFKGKKQTISFKGRDLFDLVWFLEKTKKNDWKLQPNWKRVFRELKTGQKKEIIRKMVTKVEKIDKKDVYNDLLPFIESFSTIKNFSDNFDQIIKANIKNFLW